jgi:hypothetical protein
LQKSCALLLASCFPPRPARRPDRPSPSLPLTYVRPLPLPPPHTLPPSPDPPPLARAAK